MELDILKREVLELDEMLRGGFIAKIYQPLPREIVLKVRLATFGERRLVLSADPGLGRCHTTSLRIPNPSSPPRFCAYLRAHLQGSRIESIDVPVEDRIVVLNCVRGHGDSQEKRALILELIGRDSNIILLRRDDSFIMECLQRIYPKRDDYRSVIPGVLYRYPPANPVSWIKPDHKVTNGEQQINKASGKLEDPGKLKSVNRFDIPDTELLDTAIDRRYAFILEKQILEAFRRSISAPLKTRIKSLVRRSKKIEEDRNRLETYSRQQKYGELIKFSLKKIHKGMTEAELFDWETNTLITVKLDPSLSPHGNMEVYFAKSSKARRGLAIVEERFRATNEEIEALQDIEYLVSEASSVEDLEQFADEIQPASKSRSQQKSKQIRKQTMAQSKPFHEYTSPNGHKILVGKNSKGNELILRRLAAKNDLWLHARGIPGAHVFVLSQGNLKVTDDDIEFASSLALAHSKARTSGKHEVILTSVQEVYHPKGAQSGRVKVKKFRTVMAVPAKTTEKE